MIFLTFSQGKGGKKSLIFKANMNVAYLNSFLFKFSISYKLSTSPWMSKVTFESEGKECWKVWVLFGTFSYHPQQEIIKCKLYQGFSWKNWAKVTSFQRIFFCNCHIWTIGLSTTSKYSRILKFFIFSSVSCSQIWLFPLVDDCKCAYITKAENFLIFNF